MGRHTEWIEGHFIAGDIALDFANTVYRRWPEPGVDLFTDTDARGAFAVVALRASMLVLNPPSQGVRACDGAVGSSSTHPAVAGVAGAA